MNKIIIGYGKTGKSLEKFLKKKYPESEIFIYDDSIKDIENQVFELPDNVDECYCSPGFRTLNNPISIIKEINSRNIPIYSDIDAFLETIEDKKKIAITGTNGKSTTTALLSFCLNKLGKTAVACGNIGEAVLDVDLNYEYFVVELSSYQIEISKKLDFDIALIMNITEDHVDYHGSFKNYKNAKLKLLKHSKKSFTNVDLDLSAPKFSGSKNADVTVLKKDVFVGKIHFGKINNEFLRGTHNDENVAAVISVLCDLGFKIEEIINAINQFKGLAHRMELVKTDGFIEFINDSKATNFDSTKKALDSIQNDIILIAGGKYKGDDISEISGYKQIKKILLIGKSIDEFKDMINVDYEYVETIKKAIKRAIELTQDIDKKTTILLSPFCASFDQYKNFEERGDDFKAEITGL